MIPLLPFVAGLFAGVAAVSALRSDRARSVIDDTGTLLRSAVSDAESGVRAAAQSGLAMLRRSPTSTAGAEETAPAAPEAASPPPAAAKKSARARKSTSPPPDATATKAKPQRAPRKPKAAETEA